MLSKRYIQRNVLFVLWINCRGEKQIERYGKVWYGKYLTGAATAISGI